jgi:DNA polymerase-1
LRDAQLTLVDSWEEAQRFIDWLGQRREYMACDTETNGLKWWLPNQVRMIQFGDTESGWAIPMHRWSGLAQTALQNFSGSWIMHNMPFDLHQIEESGLPVPARHRVHDTKILHHIQEPLSAHGLKRIAVRKWGLEAAVGEKELKRAFAKNKWFWDTVPYDLPAYWAYAAMDTVLTARLFADLRSGTSGAAYQRELDVARLMWAAEKRGMRIDNDYTDLLAGQWLQEMLVIQSELDQWGLTNANSRVQLLAALQAEIAFEPGEWTATGEPKLTEGILSYLPGDVAPKVLRYRRLRKWSSAYLQHFLHEQTADGRVHPSINTMAARTGRMSVTKPAMQTLPRGTQIRDCIIPSDGRRLLTVDYDTMELRVGASFAHERALIAAFLAEKDLHTFAAALVYGIEESDVSKYQRQITKNTQYGKFYCAGIAKLAATAGIPEPEVRDFVTRWDNYFPDVDGFIQRIIKLGEQRVRECGHGYVRTSGGRQVWCEPGEEYKLVNGLIQGSCRDVFGQVLVNLDNSGLGDLIVIPNHDEVVFDVPREDFNDVRHDVEDIMTWTEFEVPLTVHASGPLERWGDGAREKE